MLFRVTFIDSDTTEDGKFVTKLAGRTEDGKRDIITVLDHDPYIFAPESDNVPADERVVGSEDGYESFDGVPLQKIRLSHSKHANNPKRDDNSIRHDLSDSYEADIPYYRRCALDGLTGHIEIPGYKNTVRMHEIDTDPDVDEPIQPRICIGDIEVLPDYEVPFNVMKEQAKQPLICATWWDSYEDTYTIMALDSEFDIATTSVKYHLKEHWPEEYQEYVEADFELVRVEDEEEMCQAIVDYFKEKKFDVVGGWNFVDFDWEYVLRYIDDSPVNLHGLSDLGYVRDPEWASGDEDYPSTIERAVPGLPAFDMMEAYCDKMTFHNWRSKSLDYVADEELGVGKVEGMNIHDAYEDSFSKLLAYNIIDVQLTVILERQNEIYDFFFNLADTSSILIYDTFSELRLVDGYILSRREDDEILPVAEQSDLSSNAGGLVLDSKRGIEDWVGVFDLASLYPSCIITCNISTETMGGDDITVPDMPEHADDVGGHITEDDIKWDSPIRSYSTDKEGIIPKYVKGLFKDRQYFKDLRDQHAADTAEYEVYDRKQAAVKVIMNSFYGVMSSKYWRLGKEGLGDSVTGAGRYVLWTGAQIMEDIGYEVLAGDTDSVMVGLYDDDEEFNKKKALLRGRGIESELNTKMKYVASEFGIEGEHPYLRNADLHGTEQHCLSWEFEKLFRRFLGSGRKKRYAGHLIWEEGHDVDKTKITGFESQRSDVPETAAEAQEEVISKILSGNAFNAISDYVRSHMDAITDEFEPRTHALPSVINKAVEEYPNRPMKRAVQYSNEHLDYQWNVGDSPWLVYVSETPPDVPTTDIIAIDWTDDVPEGFRVDADKMQEKNLEQPLGSIIDIAGYDWREIKSGKKAQEVDASTESIDNPFSSSKSEPKDEGSNDLLSNW